MGLSTMSEDSMDSASIGEQREIVKAWLIGLANIFQCKWKSVLVYKVRSKVIS